MQKKIFPKYPEITNELKAEALLRYKRSLKGPLSENMNKELLEQNKKSIYRTVEFKEKNVD